MPWWWVASAFAQDEVGTCAYRAVLFAAQSYADPAVPDLATPNRDVELIAEVLRDRFGFRTEVFPDATRQVILDRMERLQGEVAECDAVVVYYAGHGELDDKLGSGFWLPVDARHDSKANWISNDDVASRVRALPARHVLLLADSCFAGSLFRGIEPAPVPAGTDALARARRISALKSRVVITSGGEEPVADQYLQSGASVFAYFLHQQLAAGGGRFVTPEDWFYAVRDRVLDNAHQQPQLGRLFGAGHEGGALVMVDPTSAEAGVPTVTEPVAPRAAAPLTVAPRPADTFVTPLGVELLAVRGGSFSPGGPQARTIEVPSLWVTRAEVTQALYEQVMHENPSRFASCGPQCPVERVTWRQAVDFANALSAAEGLEPAYVVRKGGEVEWKESADGYRLLTEAEWEYVARATPAADLGAVAWFAGNAGEATHPVCTRAPSALGLCDLFGNVAEWLWDEYRSEPFAPEDRKGPSRAAADANRQTRGGSWADREASLQLGARDSASPDNARTDVGIRLARPQER